MASFLRRPRKFHFPYTTFQEDLAPYLDSETVVVSFFGPSSVGARSYKVRLFDEVMGYQVFRATFCDEPPQVDPVTLSHIEGCYSSQKKVLFLHLIGMYDTYSLVNQVEKMKGEIEEKGFMAVWAELKHSYTRALLFLFHISHILIMNHPSCNIDTTSIKLFKAIDTIRFEILPAVIETLSLIPGISPFWASTGRFCIPRVLWFFENCPPAFRKGPAKKLGVDVTTEKLKQVGHEFEDIIYNLLWRTGVVSDADQNSLFLFPRNMEFVFMVFEEDPIHVSFTHYLINSAIDSFRNSVEAPEQVICFGFDHFKAPSEQTTEERFTIFLQQHIDNAFSPLGFRDGSSHQANMMNHTETPRLGVLLEAANALYDLIVRDNNEAASAMLHLQDFMNTDMRFSDASCAKAMPLALSRYLRDLPIYYIEEDHHKRVKLAVQVFKNNARGPLVESYVTKLEADLKRYWLCEGSKHSRTIEWQKKRSKHNPSFRRPASSYGVQGLATAFKGRDIVDTMASGFRRPASSYAVQGLATAFKGLDIADTMASGEPTKKDKRRKNKKYNQKQDPPKQSFSVPSCPPVKEVKDQIDYEKLGAIPRNRGASHMRRTGAVDYGAKYSRLPPLPPINVSTMYLARSSGSASTSQGLDIAGITASGSSSTMNAPSYKPPKYQRRKKPEETTDIPKEWKNS